MPHGMRGNRSAGWVVALLFLMVVCSGAVFAQNVAQDVAQDAARGAARAPGSVDAQQGAPATQDDGTPHPASVKPGQAQPAIEQPASSSQQTAGQQTAGSADQPGGAAAAAADTGIDPSLVFRTEVEEVLLHATVTDENRRPVVNLNQDAFQIFEDGQPQRIVSFRREDVPVAMGIVIDNSRSMREKRPSVNAAAMNLVRAGNPQDQVCVINFNNEYYLDQDFTGDVALLQSALDKIESRGGTALYDALMATSEHLMKSAKQEKKVILVVTDGEDTASHRTLEEAVRAIAVNGGPSIYSIGILEHGKEKEARRALRILAEKTGGAAFFPEDIKEVEAISQEIAHDIRNQYTIAYKPSVPEPAAGYRQLVVKASASGYKGLSVRTRSGYFAAGEETPPASR
jgi:Ca-activated chloride channel homolog